MKEKIRKIFKESMAIESFTHTSSERDIEAFLDRELGKLPYFKEHPELFGSYAIPHDFYGRAVNWALVKNDTADTVVLFHHHDTVDIEDFGNLRDVALDNDALKQKLADTAPQQVVLDDLASDVWQFGRGSCDMKAALALQLGVLETYSQQKNGHVNLLYLSVGDEESYSQGMRAATELLYDLKQKYQLNYLLAIDSEPFESTRADEKVLHIGTVGKLLPVVVTQGILSHMKEPLTGVNAISLLAKIVEKIDLNPALSDSIYGERSPLPSWSYMRDLKEHYDVSTVLHAAAYLSVLYLEKSPQELMTILQDLSQEAIDEFYSRYRDLQETYGEKKQVARPRLLTYQQLVEECRSKENFTSVKEELDQAARQDLKNGKTYQEITIETIQKLLDFHNQKEALVILAVAPPYYPSMNCRHLQDSPIDIEALISLYQDFLENEGKKLTVEEFFMGICDISYCALEKPVEDYQHVLESLAVPADLYQIDFSKMKDIRIPAVNLGPWGKDLHQISERVYEKDMLETIPNFLLHLLENIELIKKSGK